MGTKANLNQLGLGQISFQELIDVLVNNSYGQPLITKEFRRGDFIYLPNDACSKVFIVKTGRVKIGVYSQGGKELINSVVQQTEVFGEMGLIGKELRGTFAQAMEKTEVYTVSLEVMKKVMKTNITLNMQLTQLVGQRLLRTQKRLESQLFKDTRTRIIEFLRDLGHEKGQRIGYELLVRKFFTHQEIANFTGSSRQTVTTILNELRTDNFIYFDRNKLLIRDINELSKLVA